MSINLIHAMTNREKLVRKYGKYFPTIDFTCNGQVSKETLRAKGENVTAGLFHFGGNEFPVTLMELSSIAESAVQGKCRLNGAIHDDLSEMELNRIVETCNTARHIFFQRYRFAV